jgi:hypothetical protein
VCLPPKTAPALLKAVKAASCTDATAGLTDLVASAIAAVVVVWETKLARRDATVAPWLPAPTRD